jgi:hypothetical protein
MQKLCTVEAVAAKEREKEIEKEKEKDKHNEKEKECVLRVTHTLFVGVLFFLQVEQLICGIPAACSAHSS